jgi:hypothetical protein
MFGDDTLSVSRVSNEIGMHCDLCKAERKILLRSYRVRQVLVQNSWCVRMIFVSASGLMIQWLESDRGLTTTAIHVSAFGLEDASLST